jgi:hypothetical protein
MACIINASTSAGLVQTADLSGNVAIQNNGTTAVTVTSGNVGINTTTPSDKLDVNGNVRISGAGYFSIYNADNTTFSQIRDSGGAYVSQMEFYTAGSERMRIDNSGNLMVGTTTVTGKTSITPSAAQQGYAAISPVSYTASHFYANSATAASTNFFHHLCYSNSVVQFLVYGNGITQNAANSYGGISDIKLKENIVLAGSQWNDIKALGQLVKKYNFKNDPDKKQQIGWIAQDVKEISPGLIVENPDLDSDGKPTGETTLGIAYSVAYMKAVKALGEALIRIEATEKTMQEQQALIESLTTRLTTLEAK